MTHNLKNLNWNIQESVYVCSEKEQFIGKWCLSGTFSLHLKYGGNERDPSSLTWHLGD